MGIWTAGRGWAGGAVAVMGVLSSCCGPSEDGIKVYLPLNGVRRALTRRLNERLGATGSRGWSGTITPLCPFAVARSRGVLPS